jgi:hypothetical protein
MAAYYLLTLKDWETGGQIFYYAELIRLCYVPYYALLRKALLQQGLSFIRPTWFSMRCRQAPFRCNVR